MSGCRAQDKVESMIACPFLSILSWSRSVEEQLMMSDSICSLRASSCEQVITVARQSTNPLMESV